MATLIVLQGPDKGRTLRTSDDLVLLGRGSAQIPLTDQTISRRHAELKKLDGGWVLSDLNSANGTYINGVRAQKPVRLKQGDQVRLGSTLLVYAGDESVQQFSGANIPHDLVTLDAGSRLLDSSVVASLPANEDSIVMAAPETAYAVRAWNVLRELANVIGSLLPADQLLARVLDIIFQEVEVDRGVVFMRDEATGDLLPVAVRLRSGTGVGTSAKDNDIIASRTILNHVTSLREGVLCSNVAADQRFESGKSVQNLGMRSVLCVPIVAREHVLGAIHLDCAVTHHTYSEPELRLLTAIGHQTGLALENARLVQAHMAQERLAAAGETVAYLSHYIKNILQGMRSGAEVVERGLAKRDLGVTMQGWRIVARSLDRSYNLMMNMLAFSKDREPRLEMLQLNRIIEDAVALVQKLADERQVVLLTDLDEHCPPLPLDYDGVHQVALNMLTNAIDAVEKRRGVVSVRTRYDGPGRAVTLSVADNGPGVAPEMRERLFQPFHSSKGQGGTGLGLAVSRKIVHELGGTIELLDPPDGGAEFLVRLPIRGDELASGETRGPRP